MRRSYLGLFGMMILAAAIIASPLSVSAQTYQQTVATDAGTVKVGINTDPVSPKPGEAAKLKIDFLNSQTGAIQEHIDYTVTVTNAGSPVFGPIPLTHTSIGTSTIPMEFKAGENQVVVEVQGILFRPIPTEKATFSITLGDKQGTTQKEQATPAKPAEKAPADEKKTSKTGSVSSEKKTVKTPVKKNTAKKSAKKVVKTPVKKPVKKVVMPVKKTITPKKTKSY